MINSNKDYSNQNISIYKNIFNVRSGKIYDIN